MNYYPISLSLRQKKVLVVGAGCVAERKIKTLLISGARIKVVSPSSVTSIIRWAKKGKLTLVNRKYKTSDVNGVRLVIAATSDYTTNTCVSRDAKKKRVFVNVVDEPSLSDFISPAVFRLRKAMVAVYTDGRDPVLSRDLKNFLKEHWNNFLSYRSKRKSGIGRVRSSIGADQIAFGI